MTRSVFLHALCKFSASLTKKQRQTPLERERAAGLSIAHHGKTARAAEMESVAAARTRRFNNFQTDGRKCCSNGKWEVFAPTQATVETLLYLEAQNVLIHVIVISHSKHSCLFSQQASDKSKDENINWRFLCRTLFVCLEGFWAEKKNWNKKVGNKKRHPTLMQRSYIDI